MKNLKDYIYLKDLVADCGGIENFRFFGHLNKYETITPFGFAITSCSDDWVECKIQDDFSYGNLYTLEYGYKVNIVPVNSPCYANEKVYQSDLLSMLKSGRFILKTNDSSHIEEKEGLWHLCREAYIHHTWSEIVN